MDDVSKIVSEIQESLRIGGVNSAAWDVSLEQEFSWLKTRESETGAARERLREIVDALSESLEGSDKRLAPVKSNLSLRWRKTRRHEDLVENNDSSDATRVLLELGRTVLTIVEGQQNDDRRMIDSMRRMFMDRVVAIDVLRAQLDALESRLSEMTASRERM